MFTPARPPADPGMWRVVEAAITDGWQATTRLCLFVLVRYGPRCGLAAVALRAIQVLSGHHGL
jgi:hypothetical protein